MSLVSKNNVENEKNKVELVFNVSAEDFDKACQNVYNKKKSKIEVAGFRKGKAPRKTIEKLYGEGVFFEDAVNAVYGPAVEDAIKESGLELGCPVTPANVEVTEVSKENGVAFKAVVVVKPEINVKNYKGIKASKNVKEVTDEDVDAELNRRRERNARTITVEGRAAANDDIANIDFEGFIDGVAFEGGKGEKFDLTLGSGQFIPGFEDQIVGHNVGDEFDVNVSFPEEYHVDDLKGKPAVFKVKLNELKGKELPELNDEFAKDTSEFDTVDALKEDIRKNLADANEKAAANEFEEKLIDSVIENIEGDIPTEMYEFRIDEMIRDFEGRLNSQGLQLDMYLQYTGMDKDSFRKTFEAQATRQVQISLALEKIVELENIVASEEEINAEYVRLAEAYSAQGSKIDAEELKKYIPAENVANEVANNKAIDLIRDSACAE